MPKQRQEQVQQHQAQAQKFFPRKPLKPDHDSACAIVNLDSRTITEKLRTNSQPKIQSIGAVLKQAQWILQLMQAKLSQEMVVQRFVAISQAPHTEIVEKKSALKSTTKGPTKFFLGQTSTKNSTKQWISKLPK